MQSVSLLAGLGANFVPGLPIATIIQPTQPAKGTCSADGVYIWDITAGGTGYWRRKSATEQCTAVGTAVIDQRDHTGDAETNPNYVAQGGVSVTPTTVMKVGPFTIPVVRSGKEYTWGLDSYDKLTAEQASWIKEQMRQRIDYPGRSNWIDFSKKWDKYSGFEPAPGSTSYRFADDGRIIATSVWPPTAPWGVWLTAWGWIKKIGFTANDAGYEGRYDGFDKSKYTPIATFDHPESGKKYGVWMRIQPVGPLIPATSTTWENGSTTPDQTISHQLQFRVSPMPDKGLLGGFWDWIMKYVKKAVVGFYEGVYEAAEGISDALCAITATPGATAAAAAAGGPYAAGAAQATQLLLEGKCPIPNPTPAGDPGPQGAQSTVPWGLIAAVGVATLGIIAFMFASPKKRPSTKAA